MSIWKLRAYLDQMPRLRAGKQIAAISAASFAWMSSSAQRDTMRDLNRELGRGNEKPVKATVADLAALGIPVVRTNSKDEPSEG